MRLIKTATLAILLCLLTLAVARLEPVRAQDDEDPAAFIIAMGSQYSGGSGWYSGYVIAGQSGTYTLNISLSGSQSFFPVTGIKVIAAISDEAQNGGLVSVVINGVPLSGYTAGAPSYYGASGGPFSEPDYYGYNDQYVIPQLTYSQAHYPTSWYQITAVVTFSSAATQNSKVFFFCYGTDAKGNASKTPFSQGTLFVVPEYTLPVLSSLAFFGAFAIYKKRGAFKVRAFPS